MIAWHTFKVLQMLTLFLYKQKHLYNYVSENAENVKPQEKITKKI